MKVRGLMTSDPACCVPDSTAQEAAKLMGECDCGEVPVIDNVQSGRCRGIVAPADVVRAADEHETAEVVRDVSRRSGRPSMVGAW